MSTQFLKWYDEFVLRRTKDIVRVINMPLPTQEELIVGVERRPLYPRGDIGDSSVKEDTGEELPGPQGPQGPQRPLGAYHFAGTKNYFVVGHEDPHGQSMEVPLNISPGLIKGQKYLQKIIKRGHKSKGYIF